MKNQIMIVWTLSTEPNHQSTNIPATSEAMKLRRKKQPKDSMIMRENRSLTQKRNPSLTKK